MRTTTKIIIAWVILLSCITVLCSCALNMNKKSADTAYEETESVTRLTFEDATAGLTEETEPETISETETDFETEQETVWATSRNTFTATTTTKPYVPATTREATTKRATVTERSTVYTPATAATTRCTYVPVTESAVYSKSLDSYIGMKTRDLFAEFGYDYEITERITFDFYYISFQGGKYEFGFSYENYGYEELEEWFSSGRTEFPPLTGNETVTWAGYSGDEVKTITDGIDSDITLGELRSRFSVEEEDFTYGMGGDYLVEFNYNGLSISCAFESSNPSAFDSPIIWEIG